MCRSGGNATGGNTCVTALVDNYCLHPKYWSTKCYYCLKQIKYAGGLRTDTNWPPVRFCNKDCLDKDAHYKYEKKHLPKLFKRFQNDKSCVSDLLLLARCLRTFDIKKGKETFYRNTFEDLLNMVYQSNDQRTGHEKIVKAYMELFQSDGDDHQRVLPEDQLQNVLRRFGCNNFSVTNSLVVSVAAACVPIGALLNHSCDPNCVVTYRIMENSDHIIQEIRTVKDVKPGEELCHPYLDTACTKIDRQRKLKEDYNFECQCKRCKSDATHVMLPLALIQEVVVGMAAISQREINDEIFQQFANQAQTLPVDLEKALGGDIMSKDLNSKGNKNPRRDNELKLANVLVEKAAAEDDPDRELKLLLQCKKVRLKWLHPLNLQNLSVTNSIMTTALLVNKADMAIASAYRALDVYSCIYNYSHPIIGVTHYTLGSIFLSSEIHDPRKALYHLGAAKNIFTVCHGTDSEAVQNVLAWIKEAQELLYWAMGKWGLLEVYLIILNSHT